MERKKITIYAGITVVLLGISFFAIYTRVFGRKELIQGLDIRSIKDIRGQKKTGDEVLLEIKDAELYIHKNPSFSFRYQKEFKVTSHQPPGTTRGEVVVIEHDQNESFQIAITPFDEKGPITKARIVRDLPDIPMGEEDNTIQIGYAHALGFKSADEAIGQTYEIWFVAGGYLYQISAPLSFRKNLMNILSTWIFKIE